MDDGKSRPAARLQQLQANLIRTQALVLDQLNARIRAQERITQLTGSTAESALARAQLAQVKRQLLRSGHKLERRAEQQTAELIQHAEQLKALAAQLTLNEQHEREQLAGLLHDGLQQILVGAKLVLHPFERATDPAIRAAGQEALDLLSQALGCSRTIAHALAPPLLDKSAFRPTMEWLRHWMQEKYGLHVELTMPDAVPPLADPLRILLFQAVRELLFNVLEHAKVIRARLQVRCQHNHLRVIVQDTGIGFVPGQALSRRAGRRRFGLFSIRERLGVLGGRMEVRSAPGKGTRITLMVPLDPRQNPPVE